MKQKTVITLEITFDTEVYANPCFWDWQNLASMDDDDQLEVTILSHETEGLQ
jgi:hypothetical protein